MNTVFSSHILAFMTLLYMATIGVIAMSIHYRLIAGRKANQSVASKLFSWFIYIFGPLALVYGAICYMSIFKQEKARLEKISASDWFDTKKALYFYGGEVVKIDTVELSEYKLESTTIWWIQFTSDVGNVYH